jgi:hypothetical protein
MKKRKYDLVIFNIFTLFIPFFIILIASTGCTQQKQNPVAGDSAVKATQGGTGTGVMVDEKDQKLPLDPDKYKPMPMPNPGPQEPPKGGKAPVESVTKSTETQQKPQENQNKD